MFLLHSNGSLSTTDKVFWNAARNLLQTIMIILKFLNFSSVYYVRKNIITKKKDNFVTISFITKAKLDIYEIFKIYFGMLTFIFTELTLRMK